MVRAMQAARIKELWSILQRKCKALFRPRRMDADLQDELTFHLAMREQQLRKDGLAKEEARHAAQRAFGNAAALHETTRSLWTFQPLEHLARDFRFALRQLRKSPAFATAAILTLALGIGANVAIFSAVYSILLRPLPFKSPDRLLIVRKQNQSRGWDRNSISAPEFLAWRSQVSAFEDMAAYSSPRCTLNSGDQVEEDPCEVITANLFSVLGVKPLLGRAPTPDENGPGRARVVVLSYGLWRRLFGGQESAVGRSVQLNGQDATIVGVMPAGFRPAYASPYGAKPQMWVSGVDLSPAVHWNNFVGVARLKPHATRSQAQAEMDAISIALEQSDPDLKGWRAQLMTLRSYSGDLRPSLLVLMGAVAFVLLIACANVANLLLARGAGRTGEFAVRTALGASRNRLIAQLLMESLLISIFGGALGILLAWFGNRILIALAPPFLLNSASGLSGSTTEWGVLLFAGGLAILTTLLFGLAPAIQSARLGMAESIKESGRSTSDSLRSRRIRASLVVSQISLAVVLLTCAGLMLRTLQQLRNVQLGFNSANMLTMRVPLVGEHYKRQQAIVDFWRRVTTEVKALPGVENAAVAWGLPLDNYNGLSFSTAENPNPPAGQVPDANYLVITPGYFQTLKVPLIEGRAFTEQDGEEGNHVAIVNRELARLQWPGKDPIGRRIRLESADNRAPWLTVVGVAEDVLTRGPESALAAEIYVPYNQLPWALAPPRYLMVRTQPSVAPESVAAEVVQAIHRIDNSQPVADIRTMEQIAESTRTNQRMLGALLGAFAALALLLAAIGIYSVLSYSVAQRTREIGLRVALGAGQTDVLHLVLRGGLRLILLGIACGIIAAALLTRLMTGLLYGVHAGDPLTFLAAIMVLGGASFAACYLPARRASRLDPMLALRHQS